MKKHSMLFALLLFGLTFGLASAQNWRDVENALGRTGKVEEGALRVEFPRSDVRVTVKGIALEPDVATTTIISFQPIGGRNAIMTAEFVLLENEVSGVMSRLVANRIDIAAIHNHLLFESPKMYFLHASIRGNRLSIAKTLRSALATTKTPMGPKPSNKPATYTWSRVESILKHNGERSGSVLMVTVPTRERVRMDGAVLSPTMDPAHDINFQALSTQSVVGAGEIACTVDQVYPVVRALQNAGIAVTAIHNHFLFESPRLMYVHYYATGDPAKIASGLRTVLDRVRVK